MSESAQVAVAEDVETSLLRPLSENERTFVGALLAQALSLIVSAAECGPETWTEAFRVRAVMVQAEMVARRLRNPEGKYTESDGQYQYARDRSVASGRLELTDADKAALGLLDRGLHVWLPQYGPVTGGDEL